MENFDYIIVGAGPAGLSSAVYASRSGLETLVLDSVLLGGQAMQITDLENYPGVFPSINGLDFMENMKKQAIQFGAKVKIGNVLSIDKNNGKFIIKTKNEVYSSICLLIATGAIHRNLDIPGEKQFVGRGVSYCAICDGPFFRNKKIVVVGGGDSACSEATYLSTISKDIKIIHRRNEFRAQKAVVDKMLASGVVPIYNSIVKSVNGTNKVESILVENVTNHTVSSIETDAVFVFTGMIPQVSLIENLQKDEYGYILANEKMETSVEGLFVAGDVRSKSFRQIITAASDGAVAADSAGKYVRK
ncbi:MAG: thioredoxin-disulfide reductase [Treponema sp.]|nr:thioredoxin-disulfide reductase [Treponema sp.]